jgi:hypothetical protein
MLMLMLLLAINKMSTLRLQPRTKQTIVLFLSLPLVCFSLVISSSDSAPFEKLARAT